VGIFQSFKLYAEDSSMAILGCIAGQITAKQTQKSYWVVLQSRYPQGGMADTVK